LAHGVFAEGVPGFDAGVLATALTVCGRHVQGLVDRRVQAVSLTCWPGVDKIGLRFGAGFPGPDDDVALLVSYLVSWDEVAAGWYEEGGVWLLERRRLRDELTLGDGIERRSK
jgi:hypothetical protein